jgi:branched-chain amino acid transport system substrate-binding protein
MHRNRPAPTRRRRSAVVLTVSLSVALLAAGCGTRLSEPDRLAARAGGEGARTVGVAGTAAGESGAAVDLDGDGVVSAEEQEAAVESGTLVLDEGGSSGVPDAAGGDAAPAAGGGEPGAAAGGDAAAGSGGAGGTAAKKAPLVIGNVGTYSGPSGSAWKPGIEALKVWAKDVNARGGVDGHPVQLLSVDDGGDPARHLSSVKDMVENKKAFAFVYNIVSTSGSDAVDNYLTEKGIPVIGGDLTYKVWDKHPMYFPNGTPQDDQIFAHVSGAAKLRPKLKKFGSFTCREAEGCQAARADYPAAARRAGLDPIYNAEVSIAQPDFTSECLGARNAGVEILAVVVDPNSARRVISSCARQNFKPTFLFVATVVSSGLDGDTNANGTIGVISSAPWMATAGSGQAAFQAAVKKYAPGLKLDGASTLGYGSGVMLETAANKGLGEPASRAKLIDNLYTFKGETLGGLAPPLTFTKGKKKAVPCFFALEFAGNKWGPANGGKHLCP